MNELRNDSRWTVGALAKKTGFSTRMLRHYDSIGLLPCSGRTESGYRFYEDNVVGRLQLIATFRELGLSLKQIRRALEGDVRDVNDAVREHLADVERCQARDQEQQKLLARFLRSREPINDQTSSERYARRTVRFGAVYSQTGLGRVYGVTSRNAVLLARDTINASGGINGAQLSVETVDDATDKRRAADETRNLIQHKEVLGLLGPSISHLAIATHSVANALRTPMVATSTPGLHIVGRDCPYRRDFVFRTSLGEDTLLRTSIESYAERGQATRAVLLCTNDDKYAIDSADVIAGKADEHGIRVLDSIEFSKTIDDVVPYATRAAQLQPDLIFIASAGDLPATLMRSARCLGFRGQFAGGSCFNPLAIVKAAGGAGKGALSANSWHINNDSGNNREFVDAYRRRFGSDPDQMAAQAYAGMLILADASSRAQLTFDHVAEDRLRLRSALETTRMITPLGNSQFNDDHDLELAAYLVTMDGRSGHTLVETCEAS